MARLTWQNVAAPDFRGVGQNYEVMSRLLGNAAQAGEGMLGVFRDAHQHAADRNILQRQMAATDAASYDPSSVIGSDGGHASLDTLRGVGNHVDTLINRQIAGDTHAQNQRDWNWQNTGRDQTVANAGFLNEARARAMSGDLSFMRDPRMANLRPDIAGDVMTSADRFATSNLGRQSTAQNMEQSAYRHGRQVRTDELTDMSEQVRADMVAHGYNLDTWDAYLASRPDLPPEVANAAYDEMFRLSALTSGSGGRGGGSGRGGALSAPEQSVASSLGSIGLSAPVIAGFLGNFRAEGGYGGAEGDGGTAGGIAQWRGPRREQFRTIIGKDPTQATPEEQMRFVEWELNNPTHPSVGMTVQQRDAILNAESPEQAAELIDRYYERSNGQHRSRRVSAAREAFSSLGGGSGSGDPAQELLSSLGQRDPGRSFRQNVGATAEAGRQSNIGTTGRFLDLVTSDMNEVQVANAIAEQLGEGANIPGIEREIRKIRDRSARGGRTPITYAEAGDILMRSLAPTHPIRDAANRVLGTFDMLPFVDIVSDNPLRSSIGAGRSIDTDRLNANFEDVISDASEIRLGNVEEMARRQAAIAAAEQDRDLAQQRLLEAARAAERRPGIAQHLPRLEQAYQQAVERVGALHLAAGMEDSRQAPPEIGRTNQLGNGRETLPPETAASIPSVQDIQRIADPSTFNPQDWEAANTVFERRDRSRTDPTDSQTVARIREASNSPQEFVTNLENTRQRLYEGGVSRGERPILRAINRELSRITDAVVANRDIDDNAVAPREESVNSPTGRSAPSENRAAEVLQTATSTPTPTPGLLDPAPSYAYTNPRTMERAAMITSMSEPQMRAYVDKMAPYQHNKDNLLQLFKAIKEAPPGSLLQYRLSRAIEQEQWHPDDWSKYLQ